jgi:hypothetical protein
MSNWDAGILVPLGAFAMTVIIVAIAMMSNMRQKELKAHQELRMREMEHERRMKEMEIEKARLELDRARVSKGV